MGAVCSAKCTSDVRLDGKTAIVTGCNTGIGKYTVLDFYNRGCRVIMACRNLDKAKEAQEEILKKSAAKEGTKGEIIIKKLDLSSLNSVREFSRDVMASEKRIDILVNNAASGPLEWDNLNAEKSYGPIKNYGSSKLANILFTNELARRLEGKNVNVYAVHPGVVNSDLSRHASDAFFPGAKFLYQTTGFLQKSEEQGAQTSIYCAVDEKAGGETGLYYAECKPTSTSREAQNVENAKKLWEVSADLVKLGAFDPFTALDKGPSAK